MKSFRTLSVTAALLAMLGSGCVSLERSYPDKHFYVLEVRRRRRPAKWFVTKFCKCRLYVFHRVTRIEVLSIVFRMPGSRAIFTINLSLHQQG